MARAPRTSPRAMRSTTTAPTSSPTSPKPFKAMGIRFPESPRACGLGVGLDLPWGRDPGMVYDEVRGEIVSDSVVPFLDQHHADFGHLFVSWQPNGRRRLDARDYFP